MGHCFYIHPPPCDVSPQAHSSQTPNWTMDVLYIRSPYEYYMDMHYTENIKCNYYFEDGFNEKIKKSNINNLSMFHLNVKSLPKHFDELELYLNSLDMKFSFLGLTETWLTNDKQEFYDFPGYSCINRFRKDRKGGGVTLQVREGLPYIRRSDLEHFDSELESIFIEVDKTILNTMSNVVIAVVYRMPDSSVDVFNERITDIMNHVIQKENKMIYVMGDLNIDFLKSDVHKSTNSLIDVLYSYNVFPVITKPSRVTETSATLIDHILTNNFDINASHIQGILCSSISDHYAIFHVAGNVIADDNLTENPIIRRDMSHKNIMKFINEMKEIDLQCVFVENDAQSAYSKFHEIVSCKYNVCFPYRKLTKRYHMNKPWLSAALKQSIKEKDINCIFYKRTKMMMRGCCTIRNIEINWISLFALLRENTTMTC